MVEVEGLGKRFGDRWIFRAISFSISVGDSLIVLGDNGSGKSTLLKVLAGLLSANEGSVVHASSDLRHGLGFAGLELALYPALTVREHLEMAGKLRGCEPRSEELLARVGLDYAADREAGKLSTGMKSRLKLALAIQHRPQLLLLDEPGAALDEGGRSLLAGIASEQRERGAMILATNDKSERRLGTLELELA